jgi:hypothetical protein
VNRLVAHLTGQFGFLGVSEAELIADFEEETGQLAEGGDLADTGRFRDVVPGRR